MSQSTKLAFILIGLTLAISAGCVDIGDEQTDTDQAEAEVGQRLKTCGDIRINVPDAPSGASFFNACSKHDTCYETCGLARSTCDKSFLTNMRRACQGREVTNSLVSRCMEIANLYYLAVDQYGEEAYRKAQDKKRCGFGGPR